MYNYKETETKWQKYWEENKTFKTDAWDFSKEKYYILDMFPYPSGQGLHVGHPEGYTATDILAIMKRMQGYNVLHPMGWDAFGLPAEQYAIKTGNHPAQFTRQNIEVFKKQIKSLGLSYDWDREIATCDAEYYKWTQWIFTKLYERGLAYVDEIPVNWCPMLGTVLANEEVINGKSERGGYPVYRKPMRQWVLRITEYAERLLEDLELCDWPESTKEMQRNWIGKSEGANIVFKIEGHDLEFTVFTTRCDTLFGSTYCVFAPEHPFIDKITTEENRAKVEEYKKMCATKSDLERTDLNKEKTGVFTGAYAINPATGKKMPIWISDYVLASYGTGSIMAVPAHDQRDYEFATKFGLEIIPVLEGGDISKEAYIGDGKHINSGFLDGLDKEKAIEKMLAWLKEKGIGEKKVNYKLRDWLFSRQRYWGEPIPIVHMEDGSMKTVDVEELPLELPDVRDYEPSENGESPLAKCSDWLEVEIDGVKGRRETNTMPQWAGSCWYYLRFIDPKNDKEIASKELLNHWLPVDLYIGGAEHAVLHLLYARFWHKVLYDCKIVNTKEPFQKLFHQGMILGTNGEKMSKSKGNVINPDDMVRDYGADALRVYEMFMGPLNIAKPWDPNGIDGSKKFLERVWRLYTESSKIVDKENAKLEKVYNYTVKKVTNDYETMNYNTAISQMMIFINTCMKEDIVPKEYAEGFIKLLNPVAPHISEELWNRLGHNESIAYESWPKYDEAKTEEDTFELPIQFNGKLKATINIAKNLAKDEVEKLVHENEKVQKLLEDKNVIKEIYVPNKIYNIVIK